MQDTTFSETVGIDLTRLNIASVCQQTVRWLANPGYREGVTLANKKMFAFVKKSKTHEETKAREYSQEYLKTGIWCSLVLSHKNEDTGLFSFPQSGSTSFLCLQFFTIFFLLEPHMLFPKVK